MTLISPENIHRTFIKIIATSFLATVLLGCGVVFNWPQFILDISGLAFFLTSYPIAFYLHWRICSMENLSKVHMLLYILNPILAWIALFFMRNAASKPEGA